MKEPIIFKLPNVEGEFHIIEKRGYTGKGYRYSLKYILRGKELYYCDSFKNNNSQINVNHLVVLATNHLISMEVLNNTELYMEVR